MVKTKITYEGELRTTAHHGPSGAEFVTDAPVDNHGKGESFSPTDLMGVALGSCVLSVMGIVANRIGVDLSGETDRKKLERAAKTCPVHKSLHPDIDAPINFEWSAP